MKIDGHYDRDADIAWLRFEGYDPDRAGCEEVHFGLRETDPETAKGVTDPVAAVALRPHGIQRFALNRAAGSMRPLRNDGGVTGKSRALVLSGGGFAGGAWMLGLLKGLREEGLDLTDADLLVGTSAGARTLAQITTGASEQMLEMFRSATAPEVSAAGTLNDFVAAVMSVSSKTADAAEVAVRVANLEPLGGALATEAERMGALQQHVPINQWPDAPLLITSVEAASGERVTFDRDSEVSLLDAVAASGALPGIYPLTTIEGRRYADGGVHSLYNADLARGWDTVVIVTPQPMNELTQRMLDAELRELEGSRVELVVAGAESLKAMGPDPASLDHAGEASEAGAEEGRRNGERLAAVWST